MKNILTIDVESWIHFQRELGRRGRPRGLKEEKSSDDGYIPYSTGKILDYLRQTGNRATFFILGEVYDWYPETIELIRQSGHEIAYHGHDHHRIIDRETLENQLERSRTFIERFRPRGFRAPRLYLRPEEMKTLRDRGFTYSSSSYGSPETAEVIAGVREIPVSSYPWRPASKPSPALPRPLSPAGLAREIPFGSGIGSGLLGNHASFFIRKFNRRGFPAVILLHPWQLVPPFRFARLGAKLRDLHVNPLLRAYTLNRVRALFKLLSRNRFTSFRDHPTALGEGQ